MTTSMTVDFRSIDGTEAAIGICSSYSVVVDRPRGKAGGMGIGLNGGQLLALAIGGCLCNDLRYVSHEMKIAIKSLKLSVTIEFEDDPLLATSAEVSIDCELMSGNDPSDLIERTKNSSTVSNSLRRGVDIRFS